MADRKFECVKCNGAGELKVHEDHDFYTLKYCPFCGEELELEEGFDYIDKFEEEYNESID